MLHEAASSLPESPHPPLWAANLLNQWVGHRGDRQNVGSKEFRNKIFATKNLAACELGKYAGLFPTYFRIAIRNGIL
jgi:hypothetical protein